MMCRLYAQDSLKSSGKMFFTLLLVGVSLIFGAVGDEFCVSHPVTNLSVNRNGSLQWTAPENSNDACNVSFYVVNIVGADGVIFHYDEQTTSFDVSFLAFCEQYNFTVTPVTKNNVQGVAATISSQLLPGADENLTVASFDVRIINRTEAVLEWEMPNGVQKCINLFRVVIWDNEGNIPHDIYVEENYYNFSDAVPCMDYEFGIRAIIDPEEDGPLSLFNYSFAGVRTTPPILAGISQGVTSVNMTWVLEPYNENRCEITALIIDASPNFNLSHPVTDSVNRYPVAFEILNLQPNTVYVSHISVVNSAGVSDSVTLPFQTLPNPEIMASE